MIINDLYSFKKWWSREVLVRVDHENQYDTMKSPWKYHFYKTLLAQVFSIFDEKYKSSFEYQKHKDGNENLIAESVAVTMFLLRDKLDPLTPPTKEDANPS